MSRQLEAALEATDGPGARTGLLVVGPRGMGKSTLLDDLEAVLDGVVVRVRGLRNVPTVPLGAATLAKTALISVLGLPDTSHPDQVVPVGTPRASGQPFTGALDPRALSAFVRLMRGVTGHRRVYLLVDDVDHVDAASRMVFALAAAHTSTLPGTLVCTATQEEDVPELQELRRLELQPLTVEDVVGLTEATRSITPPHPVARRIRELTDGRPAVVQELIEQLSDAQLLGTSLVPTTARLGDTARAAVADLVSGLPPQTLEALHLVVTSGTRMAGLVSKMLDSTGSSLEDLVDDGALTSRAGVVRPVSGLVERHLRATTTSTIRRRAARALLVRCSTPAPTTSTPCRRTSAVRWPRQTPRGPRRGESWTLRTTR